jgi:hypothetical protein
MLLLPRAIATAIVPIAPLVSKWVFKHSTLLRVPGVVKQICAAVHNGDHARMALC